MEAINAILALVGAILFALLTTEIRDWLPNLAHWIIERATARLPRNRRIRYLEEWLADNNCYPGRLAKLFHAMGCIRASEKIRNHHTSSRRKDFAGIQGNVLIERLAPRFWQIMVQVVLWVNRTQTEKEDHVLFGMVLKISRARLRSKLHRYAIITNLFRLHRKANGESCQFRVP